MFCRAGFSESQRHSNDSHPISSWPGKSANRVLALAVPAIHDFTCQPSKRRGCRAQGRGLTMEQGMTKKNSRDLPERRTIKPAEASTTKATADNSNSPFATFTEWAGEADEKAYKNL
jgi:hypothetical protein